MFFTSLGIASMQKTEVAVALCPKQQSSIFSEKDKIQIFI